MGDGWYVGAAINLVGSILINLGTNIMKLGHNKRAAFESRAGRKQPVRRFREWQIGVVLFIVGNIANFISFGYAAQSLLAALGSVQFVSNVIFASVFLKEKVTRTVLMSTACIVLGCIGLVYFGSHESRQFTVEELVILYHRPVYIAYIFFAAAVVITMYAVYKFGLMQTSKDAFDGYGTHWHRVLPISYALYSGLLGTQSVLFSKTISTLLRVTFNGNSQMSSWFTWVIVLAFLCTSTFWVTRLNKALKLFPALIIVPTMQISWTLFSILSGMLYFEEYKSFTLSAGLMFSLSVLIVFSGVFLLTKDQRVEHSEFDTKYGSEDSCMDSSDMISSGSSRGRIPSPDAYEGFKTGDKPQVTLELTELPRDEVMSKQDGLKETDGRADSPGGLTSVRVEKDSFIQDEVLSCGAHKGLSHSFCPIEDSSREIETSKPGVLTGTTRENPGSIWSVFRGPKSIMKETGHTMNLYASSETHVSPTR